MYNSKEKDGGDKAPETDNDDDSSMFFEDIDTGETGKINI